MENKAVILGANYYIGLSVIRCLGIEGINVTAVDYSREDAYAFHSKYCSETLIAPHYKEDPGGFVGFLTEYAGKQSRPPVLFPCADPYVEIIDEHLTTLKEHYLISQEEQGLYTRIMKKGTLHKIALEHGVAVPETISVNEENFIEKAEKMIKFPALVKPVDSHSFVSKFRKKLFKVNNREELIDSVEMARRAGTEVVVQRIIPGFDDHMYTFDAHLNGDAKVTHWVTCRKLRQYPINYGASVYTVQEYVPELYEIGAGFLEAIGFRGFAEIEFKKDAETGQFYLIEVNVRTTNLNSLLYKTGMNMPYIAYRELTGAPLEPRAVTRDTNTVFWYAYEDLLAARNYVKTGQLSLRQVMGSYFKPKAYAVWDWKDPRPSFIFLLKVMKQAARKILRLKKPE